MTVTVQHTCNGCLNNCATVQKEQRSSTGIRSARPKIKVDGARRIWGSVPTCSTRAITTTISKLVSTEFQLQVKRKTRIHANNKTVWWFIVRGSENDLTILQQEWNKVQTQTLWTLKNCYNIMVPPNANQSENQSGRSYLSENADHTQMQISQSSVSATFTATLDVGQPAEYPLPVANSPVATNTPSNSNSISSAFF